MSPKLKEFLQRWIICAVAVLVAANLVSGIDYNKDWSVLLVATLLLGFLNSFLRPILMLLSLPVLILTLGLFMLVINALLLELVGELVKGFHVASFWAALKGALVISIVTIILNIVTGVSSASANFKVKVGRTGSHRPPPGDSDSGSGGPLIDV